jgi:hypothetical protein
MTSRHIACWFLRLIEAKKSGFWEKLYLFLKVLKPAPPLALQALLLRL